VKVAKGLNEASGLLLAHSDEIILKETTAFLISDQFDDSPLKMELDQKMLEKLSFMSLDNDNIGLGDAFESPSIDMVHEDYEYRDIIVEPLANGEISISLNVSVTCLIDVFVPKYEVAHLEESDGLSVYDYEWNNHYVAGQIEKKLWFEVDFISDVSLKEISSFEIKPDDTLNLYDPENL
jgi:hypothetical protein